MYLSIYEGIVGFWSFLPLKVSGYKFGRGVIFFRAAHTVQDVYWAATLTFRTELSRHAQRFRRS